MVIVTECLCLSKTICKTRRCSRCTEAILNEASIDRSHSERSHRTVLPTVDGMKASILTVDNEGIPKKKKKRSRVVVVVEIIGYNGVDGHRMYTID